MSFSHVFLVMTTVNRSELILVYLTSCYLKVRRCYSSCSSADFTRYGNISSACKNRCVIYVFTHLANTSLTSKGQYYNVLTVRYLELSPKCKICSMTQSARRSVEKGHSLRASKGVRGVRKGRDLAIREPLMKTVWIVSVF